MFLIDKTHFLNTSKILLMKSVLITLWVENKKLDSLFLSLSGENNTELSQTSTVFVDPKNSVPIKEKLSFSRCSQLTSRSFILTKETKNKDNYCPFNVTKALEMKLKAKEPGCLKGTIEKINSSLNDQIIQLVDSKNVQFSSWFIVTDLFAHVGCVENTNEISAKFLFQANFQELLTAVVKEYQNQISTNTHVPFLQLSGYSWILNKCTEKCTSPVEPPNTDDDHIRLTVAVVVSCVGVFLLVLIFVIIYLKNKRRGIMQFHMTRLDDEDDLIGDMDDFVGNQGPTFKNYR
ncbi:uncharacterized protein LOC131944478 [Physella acuta]|uniref:uncharacterized protein LOC131944478 n=1 Tax=Physella acuta TaxID=109671 RepID=UPI0027DE48D6|nr:uncharacterized protein LOC131944478 [Physella acuta]